MKRFLASLLLLALSATSSLALTQSGEPPKFTIPWGNSAGTPYINSIPVPSQIGIQNCRASLTDGFPPLTFTPAGAGGCPPFGADWNGILNQITAWSRWFSAGGSVPYDSTFQGSVGGYPKGAIVPSAAISGLIWFSTVDNNTSNPDSGGANWVVLNSLPQSASVTGPAATLSSSQCGGTIERSNSGSPMSDLLPGTGAILPNGCRITIVNSDTAGIEAISAASGAAIKTALSITGFAYLCPGQSATFQSDGSNYWAVNFPVRCKLQANTTIFGNGSSGSDANNGLTSSTALADYQTMWNWAQQTLDLNGFVLTLSGADASYPAAAFAGPMVGQQGSVDSLSNSVIIQCDTTTPANCPVNVNTPIGAFQVLYGAVVTIQGFKFSNSAANGSGIYIAQAKAAVTLVDFGTNSVGDMQADSGGVLELFPPYSISGSARDHVLAGQGGDIRWLAAGTVTMNGNPNFSSGFAIAQSGFLAVQSTVTWSGSAQGPHYAATLNGVIDSGARGASYFPGNIAGTATTGGQYN